MEEEKTLNISAIQMSSKIGDKYFNFEKLLHLIKRDVKKDVDVIILPEVWTVGWNCKFFRDSAEYLSDSETVNLLSSVAKEYNAYVLGGSFIEKIDCICQSIGRINFQLVHSPLTVFCNPCDIHTLSSLA